MASDDDSDDDSDEWGAEELDLSALNVKADDDNKPSDDNENNKTDKDNNDDDYWDKAPSPSPPQDSAKNKKSATSKPSGDGNPMIIVDMTEMSDGKIHNKHDRNSVNDSEAASKLRKQIEADYDKYAKDSSLLSESIVIPCSSNVYRDALSRLRDEKPGHYFAPIFPPKKK